MGGIFGRKKKNQFDPNSPFFDPYGPPPPGYGAPPPYPYGSSDPFGQYGGYSGYGGYGEYDPMDVYGYGYPPTESFESFYGGPHRRGRGKILKIEMKSLIGIFLSRTQYDVRYVTMELWQFLYG